MALTVTRADAVDLCMALGFKTADSWSRQRMLKKLADLAEMVEDGDVEVEDDVEDADRLNELLLEIAATKGDVDVVKELPLEEDAGQDEVAEAEPEQRQTEPDEAIKEADDEPEPKEKPTKSKKGKGRGKSVDRKQKKGSSMSEAGPDVGKVPGTRSIRNRRFFAGLVIREKGLEAGITEDMVREVDDRYSDGKKSNSNMKASKSQLTDAWHAINGYVNG